MRINFYYFRLYPTGFELVVECTYPINQAISLALIQFGASVQIAAMIAFENIIYRPLPDDEIRLQTCSEVNDNSHEQAKDYLPYTIFITSWMVVFGCIFVFWFHPEMKRTNADKDKTISRVEL